MFGFLRRRRRRKLLAEPFPASWQATLHREVALYHQFDAGERSRIRDRMRIFVAETKWEAVQGFELAESMQVLVAAHAAILTLGMDGEPLRHIRSIIFQPRAYRSPQPRVGAGGIVSAGPMSSGTAYSTGIVVLAWDHVVAGSRDPDDGRNVILHELAHQLDMIGGVVDGTPPLPQRDLYPRWAEVMTREFAALSEAAERGIPTLINHYGATNPGEFFAVITEHFFEQPRALQGRHPQLYLLLRAFYRQDPAARLERAR